MIKCTDGTIFRGLLEKGQVWVKGNTERIIVDFGNTYLTFKNKQGEIQSVLRSSFRKWVHSGAMLKVDVKEKQ